MKTFKILLIILFILTTGCAMFRHEAERSIKKDIKEYIAEPEGKEQLDSHIKTFIEDKFDLYANEYHNKRVATYKDRLYWTLGVISITLGIIGSLGGLVILNRKLKKKNENV